MLLRLRVTCLNNASSQMIGFWSWSFETAFLFVVSVVVLPMLLRFLHSAGGDAPYVDDYSVLESWEA